MRLSNRIAAGTASLPLALPLLLGAGGGIAATVAASTPATAVSDPLLISSDGVHFAPGPGPRLFADLGRVVPGDRARETVWVRNDSSDPASLAVALVDVAASDPALAGASTLEVGVSTGAAGDPPGAGTRTTTVAAAQDAGGRVPAAEAVALAPGATARVDVALAVHPALGERAGEAGAAGALADFSFGLEATLTQTGPGRGDPEPPADGPLAATGSRGSTTALLLGAFLLAAGGAATARGRRDRGARGARGASRLGRA
ncbi:hypothetical protein [Leucobacter luti]|uniref:hypothetical protein n=1 Tax=Leucobacter luti TaxID=340320 RepID=UPI003D028E68